MQKFARMHKTDSIFAVQFNELRTVGWHNLRGGVRGEETSHRKEYLTGSLVWILYDPYAKFAPKSFFIKLRLNPITSVARLSVIAV